VLLVKQAVVGWVTLNKEGWATTYLQCVGWGPYGNVNCLALSDDMLVDMYCMYVVVMRFYSSTQVTRRGGVHTHPVLVIDRSTARIENLDAKGAAARW
jgi:hypothetical protein